MPNNFQCQHKINRLKRFQTSIRKQPRKPNGTHFNGFPTLFDLLKFPARKDKEKLYANWLAAFKKGALWAKWPEKTRNQFSQLRVDAQHHDQARQAAGKKKTELAKLKEENKRLKQMNAQLKAENEDNQDKMQVLSDMVKEYERGTSK